MKFTLHTGFAALAMAWTVVPGATAWTAPPLKKTPPAAPQTNNAAGPRPLFDGQSFDGWEGNLEWFRIEQGAIVAGRLDKKIPRNEFLCTRTEFGDFELQLQFKVLGRGANAGVQLRSQRVPNHHEVAGYQADLGELWWGCLYDESRRNKVLMRPADEPKLLATLQREAWNRYRIRCEGRRIRTWINDVPAVDYSEADDAIPQRGILGVQIHGGPPSEAWYKDLVIEEL